MQVEPWGASIRGRRIVKLFVIFVLFFWLICGLLGAWWQDGPGNMHFKSIAKGPITMVHAFNNKPVTYPGPS
jgi:hypothetical protein